MKGSELVMRAIRREGIDTIFGFPGGAIMPVYDALVDSGLRHILVRHEQGAAHAAEGYAVASGLTGVCMSTSGPGATNLVTGIADAHLDSIPVLAITGQVAAPLMGTTAFQEVDAFGVMLPLVKYSFKIQNPEELDASVWRAFRIAQSGRPGPVHIDLPRDIALADCPPTRDLTWTEHHALDTESIEKAAAMVREAKRPLLIAGGGLIRSGALPVFRKLVDDHNLPVVCTLKGLGSLPRKHPRFLGMLGMHGSRQANTTLAECDLLIALGMRFDDRATGKLDTFCPQAKTIQFDIDPAEIDKLRKTNVSVLGNLGETLPIFAELFETNGIWTRTQEPQRLPEWDVESPCPRDILEAIDADVVTTDVGQHQMWSAQFLNFRDGMSFITSGGLGTMGFGLPAAIGAQIARPDERVVCITGDGSLMMMIQELATIRRYNLPVKIVLLENRVLGMVRQWQELFFGNRESEIDLSDNPDFLEVAHAFGIPGRRVTKNAEVAEAMKEALESDGPYFLHCRVERGANVWPLVPPGKANFEMMEDKKWSTT